VKSLEERIESVQREKEMNAKLLNEKILESESQKYLQIIFAMHYEFPF